MLEIGIKCGVCGMKTTFKMPPRESSEDIIKWMERVRALAGVTHNMESPHCQHDRCDLAIPIDQDDTNMWIGKSTERDRSKILDMLDRDKKC